MLRVENLQCGYEGSSNDGLVNRLDFKLAAGELLLLAGRNGIGKSTLMRTLAGLQAPISGNVHINGKGIHHLGPSDCAGLVSVMFSMPPDLALTRCFEVVLTAMQRNFSPFKTDFSHEKGIVKKCMELTGCQKFYDREFSTLSDGEKQKVMLARCLAQDTPVLLLDEPLAFLDYPGRRQMLSLLEEICKTENKTIVYSSHDLDISLVHCHKLLLLTSRGKWKYFEDKQEIMNTIPSSLSENEN